MPSLKELRNRIASVKATQKITKAMQMVAAAKLRRAQSAAEQARPYADRMEYVLSNLTAAMKGRIGAPPLMVGTGRDKVHLLVVCTAERGLCGGFNSAIAKLAREDARRLMADGKTVKMLCVGKKGHDALKRLFAANMVGDNNPVDLRAIRYLAFSDAKTIGDRIIKMFDAGEFDICTIYYSQFKSVISQVPTAQQVIPTNIREDAAKEPAFYEYEPDEEEILADLLPRNVSFQIFQALLENAASEQGARMSAMDSATRNAGEMIDKLTLNYNRSRQAQITKELIEIISGAEAL